MKTIISFMFVTMLAFVGVFAFAGVGDIAESISVENSVGIVVDPAAEAVATADSEEDSPTAIELIGQGKDIYDLIATKSVGAGVAVALIINFLLNFLKLKTGKDGVKLADKIIPKRYRPLVTALLGVIGGGVATFLAGGTIPMAIAVALGSGSMPVLMHELWNKTIKNETESNPLPETEADKTESVDKDT